MATSDARMSVERAVSHFTGSRTLRRRQLLDRAGKIEILRGDSTRIVRAERKVHLGVADIDVGVMLHRFGDVGHLRNECDPGRERREVIALHERVAFTRPAGHCAQAAQNNDDASLGKV